MSDIFDFGFTAVDEDELSSVEISKKIAQESSASAEQIEVRLDKLYNAIIPLLNNLKKNPEKEYILWPDRLKKVEEFETLLQKIYGGE
tara:strand:- start:164 stop:427 length:264 start_codon:yes stop_codon:yes gene_type:complete